jgi:plastocyanin
VLKRLAPALAVTLLAAACGGTEFDVRAEEAEGLTFHPQVVDVEQDSGPGLSITTDADGNPHFAYLKLPFEPEAPEVPDQLAPVLPAVAHAHLVDQLWAHSEVAEERSSLSAEDETAIAVDAEGTHHVVWTEGGRLLYSTDTTGEAKPQVVDSVDAAGLSIWADEGGTPWIAFYEVLSDAEGPSSLVRVATLDGEDWSVETAAEADSTGPYGTGVGPGQDGPVVAYGSSTGTNVAQLQGSRWESEVADPDGGLGVSMDIDADGNPHLAYLTSAGQVRHAHSIGGADWEISDVGAGIAEATTSIAVDDQGVHHIAWQRDVDIAYANNAEGEFAEVQLPGSAAGGSRPRVAAGSAGAYLAWYGQEQTRLMMAVYSEDEPLLAGPPPTIDAGGGEAPAACEPEGGELSIAAQNLEFSTDCLAAPAGQPFTIEFDNQEAVPHNVAILTEEGGDTLFAGEVITGPTTTTYEPDPIDEPGDLFFQCDVHPTTMTGTFVVAEE